MTPVATAPVVSFAGDVPTSLDELVTVRDALAAGLGQCGWSDADTFRVLLCADEAMANALTHGSENTATIDVRFWVSPDSADVVVIDRRSHTTLPATPELPDTSSEHGRGLVLMRALADTLSVRPRRLGTFVALSFCPSDEDAS